MSAAPGRPLPLLTDENEFFWKSGADGTLRLQECQACAALIHPPAPVCRYCRSHATSACGPFPAARRWPGSPSTTGSACPGCRRPTSSRRSRSPRIPRVRLTTNIVDCDPDATRARSAGRGRLRADRGRLAAAVPPRRRTPSPLRCPIDEIAPERFGEYVRPMLTAEKFEDKVALTGIGMSEIGRRLMVPPLSLTVDGLRGGRRRRRPDARRHRRPVHLSRRRQSRRASARAGSPRWRRRWASGRRGTTAASRRSARAAR